MFVTSTEKSYPKAEVSFRYNILRPQSFVLTSYPALRVLQGSYFRGDQNMVEPIIIVELSSGAVIHTVAQSYFHSL